MSKRKSKKTNYKKILKAILHFLFLVAIGVFIALIIFLLVSRGDYVTKYEMYHEYVDMLFKISALPLWFIMVFINIDFMKKLFVVFATIFILYAIIEDITWLHRKLIIENFSDTNKSVVINGKKYTIKPDDEIEFDFMKYEDVSVDNKTIQNKGCYLVNLSYKEKYYKYGLQQGISIKNSHYKPANYYPLSTFWIGEVKNKIYKLDSTPQCTVVFADVNYAKALIYRIKLIDREK